MEPFHEQIVFFLNFAINSQLDLDADFPLDISLIL